MNNFPFVTVIMPIRNEARYIRRSLSAVLSQDYPQERMEMIVADGMSTDDTREIVRSFQKQYPNLRLIDNPGKIVPTGFNLALRQAHGDFIIRVDGHTEIAPDYVRQCVAELQKSGADNVGGNMTAVATTAFGQAVALATSSPFGVGGARFHYSNKEEWVDTVYLGAWPRTVFEHIGLFDEEMIRNQDDEFNYRLLKHNGRILLSPRIISTYTPRNDLKRLWDQYFQYGFWKVRVMQKHPRQMRLRQFIPPLFVTTLLGTTLLALFNRLGRWLFALIGSAYAITNLIASVRLASTKGWSYLPLLPIVFVTLHLGYGVGFLVGLVKFRDHWNEP